MLLLHPSHTRLLADDRKRRLRADAADHALARDRETRAQADAITEALLRGTVALGLVAIALIHFLDLFSKFRETPYLGVAYLALIFASLAVGARLLHAGSARLWMLAGALAAATLTGYVLSRSVGLPRAAADIGNWQEPLGLASLFVEGLVVALSAYAAALLRRSAQVPGVAQ
jgi:hypothetical protein